MCEQKHTWMWQQDDYTVVKIRSIYNSLKNFSTCTGACKLWSWSQEIIIVVLAFTIDVLDFISFNDYDCLC